MTVMAGDEILADDVNAWRPPFARKTVTETLNNNSTFQNDNELAVAVAASTVYRFEMRLRTSTGATPELKSRFVVPSGTTMYYDVKTVTTGGTALTAFDLTEASTTVVEGGQTSVVFTGIVIVGATAGDLVLQWAQNVATVSDTSVLVGSYLDLDPRVVP